MNLLNMKNGSAIRDYSLAILVMTPMLFVGYLILEISQKHLGNGGGSGSEMSHWLQSTLGLGWEGFNWSFLVLLAFALIEFGARHDWRSILRRLTLLGSILSVGAFLLVSNFVLIFTMLSDFHALQNSLAH